MNPLYTAWDRRTTTLGYIQVALGVFAASDVLPPEWLKWVVLSNALLVALLGHYNNMKIKQAGP